ncbi:Zn(II)2Cys6 transcription factor [Aspergillus alliaceus]|uniref:Zn(II)2Cys6 transcription factor n=1 Tax=Petromyces alliaceus TaxID=209559 RepID=UPI0012A6521A|nr:fungal-specific transcription factor domain-containing protein [Aspergillus alliaceus]KAB8227678.1 fungal-specific transcription factor domain-containing protein [Aspergillus alliaceus]
MGRMMLYQLHVIKKGDDKTEMSANSDCHRRLAKQACVQCFTQKRKCSRQLPQCDRCLTKDRHCEYPSETFGGNFDLTTRGSNGVSHDSLSALFFLDTWLFRNRGLSMTFRQARIPSEFGVAINSGPGSFSDHLDRYFTMVHPFFPILSKMRTYRLCLHESSLEGENVDPALVLLMLVIHLLSITASQGLSGTGELYAQVKRCYSSVESLGIITPRVLQAALLIAYWEVGSGVYPAAYLSAGLCARLGHALGIHRRRKAPQMFPRSGSWVEVEELRRVWWGVIILDRYVTIGLIDRPFSCDDAHPEDMLPTTESSWDQGEPSVSPSLAVSGDASHAISSFARLCQASDLLSRVLRHISEQPSDMQFWYKEGIRLHYLLNSFATGLTLKSSQGDTDSTLIGDRSLHPAVGVVYSAQMLLYDMHTCADFDHLSGVGIPEQLEMQTIALAGVRVVCTAVSSFARGIRAGEVGDAGISPLTINCLYEAAKYYFWYYREANKPELLHEASEITLALQAIAGTWAVADRYLSILSGDEFRPHSMPGKSVP